MVEQFRELFMSEDALRRQFVHMCKTSAENPDPITDAVCCMLTSNLQFCVGKYGLALFKGGPTFPYTLMSPVQRQFLYELVHAVGSDVPCHSALACIDNPLTWSVENERILFHLPPEKLEPRLVFRTLLDSVATSKHGSALLCNLLVQRLGSRVNVGRDTLAFVKEYSREVFG